MKKSLDPKKLLANIPKEDELPERNSDLLRLYKRAASRLERTFGIPVKLSAYAAMSGSGRLNDDQRIFLKNECASLIRTLNMCIELHCLHASQPPEE